MANWKNLPLIGTPDQILRRLLAQLNDWAKDKDRFEKVVASPSDTSSAGPSVSLRKGRAIEASRVGTDNTGTLNPLSVTGSLIPTITGTYDIGQNSPPRRWRDLFLSRNATVAGNLDVTGTAALRSTSTLQSASVTTGLTVTGQLTGTAARFTSGVTLAGIVSGFSCAGGIAPNKDAAGTYLGRDPGGNGYDWDYISGNTCQFGLNAFDSTFAVNNKVILIGEIVSDPVYLLSGITSLGDAWFQGNLASTASAPSGLSVNGVGRFGSNLTTQGALGVTGLASLSGGATISGGATFNSMVGMVAGVSISGGSIIIQPSGASGLVFTGGAAPYIAPAALPAFAPLTTSSWSLGKANNRWAQIFGVTANISGNATISGNAAVGSSLSVVGNITGINITAANNLSFGNLFIPGADNTGQLGGGPPTGFNTRFMELHLGGGIEIGMGSTISAGTTISLANSLDGNYHNISGVSDINGYTFSGSIVSEFNSGTHLIFKYNSNPRISYDATKRKLIGGVTFSGQTGDVSFLMWEGSGNLRELFRTRASGQLFQPTGDNRPAGTAEIGAGGSINVTCNLVGTSSMIHITGQSDSGTPGFYRVGSRTAGASFNILSSSSSDTSTVAWIVIEPEGL